MITNLEKYKKDLAALLIKGQEFLAELESATKKIGSESELSVPNFSRFYQSWYSESFEFIKQLLPNRLSEFESLYKADTKRRSIDSVTYSIQDWLLGRRSPVVEWNLQKKFNDVAALVMNFQAQLLILDSINRRFESSLFDIKQLVQADLFDSELEVAKELNEKGFTRGAGAVAGVVLEKHLTQVCENHQSKIAKKNPGINDLGQLLKDSAIIETKDWRFVQHLADLRNLCDHNKKAEPTKEDIQDLINGVEKVSKTIF